MMGIPLEECPEPPVSAILKNTARWYTFLRNHGKDRDRNRTFSVRVHSATMAFRAARFWS
jgi:hypothetical protein